MTRILYPLEYVYQLMICEHFIRGVYHGIEFVKLNLIQQMLANHQLINVFKWAQNFSKEGIWFRKYSCSCVDQLLLKKTRNSYT